MSWWKKKPKYRGIYAVEFGERAGCLIAYIQEENVFKSYAFLVMPEAETILLTVEDVDDHLRDKGLVLVNRLPLNVYAVCKANYQFLKQRGK